MLMQQLRERERERATYQVTHIQYVLLITRPVIIEYAYNEGNLWVPNAPVLYITNKKPVIRETGFRRICI